MDMFISKYEQDVIMFMYHPTNYELNCHVKHKDDKVKDHHIHRQLIHHDVYPNLSFKR
jgi:hypothetical protein